MIYRYRRQYPYDELPKIIEILENISHFQTIYISNSSIRDIFYRWRNLNLIMRIYSPYYIEIESYSTQLFTILDKLLKI